MICCTPNTHICNLDVVLNGSNASPTAADRPQPAINHPILILTTAFQDAIQENDIFELTSVDHQYVQAMKSNLDFLQYDCCDFPAVQKIVTKILNSNVAASIPLPTPLPNGSIHTPTAPPPSASFKLPKLVTDNWSGQSYDFYPWLASVLNKFSLTRCDDPAKLVLTLQAIPLNKRGSFNNKVGPVVETRPTSKPD